MACLCPVDRRSPSAPRDDGGSATIQPRAPHAAARPTGMPSAERIADPTTHASSLAPSRTTRNPNASRRTRQSQFGRIPVGRARAPGKANRAKSCRGRRLQLAKETGDELMTCPASSMSCFRLSTSNFPRTTRALPCAETGGVVGETSSRFGIPRARRLFGTQVARDPVVLPSRRVSPASFEYSCRRVWTRLPGDASRVADDVRAV